MRNPIIVALDVPGAARALELAVLACQLEPGNVAFDERLRSEDPRWGLRELDDVSACAADSGFALERIVEMPANNLSVIFRRR